MNDMKIIEEMFKQINYSIQDINRKIEHMIKEIDTIKEENKTLEELTTKQEKKIGFLERETRQKNLAIKDVGDQKIKDIEEPKDKVAYIFQKMGVQSNLEVDADEIRRIGNYKADRKKPIVIKLTAGIKKTKILKQTKTLKGTDLWIEEDHTKETQDERKASISQLQEVRKKILKAYLK